MGRRLLRVFRGSVFAAVAAVPCVACSRAPVFDALSCYNDVMDVDTGGLEPTPRFAPMIQLPIICTATASGTMDGWMKYPPGDTDQTTTPARLYGEGWRLIEVVHGDAMVLGPRFYLYFERER